MTGKQFKLLRIFYGYTSQEAIARTIGVHLSSVQRWEKSYFELPRTVSMHVDRLNWNVALVLDLQKAEKFRILSTRTRIATPFLSA